MMRPIPVRLFGQSRHRPTLNRGAAARAAAAAAVLASLLAMSACATTGRPRSPAVWAPAAVLPGTAALNTGGGASVSSVSCASAGDCLAGGSYHDRARQVQSFLASEAGGRWLGAVQVPGTAVLNTGGDSSIVAVACPAAGGCSAVGSYLDSHHHEQAFAVGEQDGRWQAAVEIPGTAHLSSVGSVDVDSLSCPAAGDCTALGSYTDPDGGAGKFAVSSAHGRWGRVAPLPGLAAPNLKGYVALAPVSCGSPGNCSAGGGFQKVPGKFEAFVVTQARGRWRAPEVVRGNVGFGAEEVTALSCAGPGDCSAAGTYSASSFRTLPFVVQETDGVWGAAEAVAGAAALTSEGVAIISSLSCAAPGSCSAAGSYEQRGGTTSAFVLSEADGRWGATEEAPGLTALNTGGNAVINSVSCWAPGQCAAGGSYTSAAELRDDFGVTQRVPERQQAFVLSERSGV